MNNESAGTLNNMTGQVDPLKTSVSVEPKLDSGHIDELVDVAFPYVADKIRIGKMNGVRQRVPTKDDPITAAVRPLSGKRSPPLNMQASAFPVPPRRDCGELQFIPFNSSEESKPKIKLCQLNTSRTMTDEMSTCRFYPAFSILSKFCR